MTAPELLTTAEVAALLRTPESTLRYWRWQGTGPQGVKVGRRVLYRQDAVEAWIESLERTERRLRVVS